MGVLQVPDDCRKNAPKRWELEYLVGDGRQSHAVKRLLRAQPTALELRRHADVVSGCSVAKIWVPGEAI